MPKRILVVDDEPEIAFLIKRRLIKNGYEVFMAHDGASALSLVKKERPDVIILDIMMPEPDGLQVCRTLKQDPQYRSVPIILLSARDQQKDKDAGQQAGADMYITKPFEPDDLMRNVKALLGE